MKFLAPQSHRQGQVTAVRLPHDPASGRAVLASRRGSGTTPSGRPASKEQGPAWSREPSD